MKKEKKCICKHKLSDHGLYANNGKNVNNNPYVCQKDGCSMWAYCDISTPPQSEEKEL